MDCTLQGIPGTICYLDDILVVSKGTLSQHTEIVYKVLSMMDEEGLALKLSKCEFGVDKFDWLSFDIHSSGCSPKFSKIEAVRSLKAPRTLKQLRSFMGTLNHFQKFMPGLHNLTCEFQESLKLGNKRKFVWKEPQEGAFQKILDLVAEITDLILYDPAKKTRVKCDASHSGLGTCLEQETDAGLWVPLSFASRFLNSAELKYNTNELELLAVVWAYKHFRTYLLGNKFEILTDHKAIISALKEHRGNRPYQSRLTRWADRLLPFDYDIRHVPGATLGMVDYLSRNPTFDAPPPSSVYDELFVIKAIENFTQACNSIMAGA